MTGGLRRNLEDFASLREQEPDKVQELQGEVHNLQKDLNGLEARQHISKNDERSAIVRELEDICATLEREVALKESGEPSSGDGLGTLLSELESVHHQKSFNGEESLSVAEVVQAAWMLDQEAILTLQEEILDEVCLRSSFAKCIFLTNIETGSFILRVRNLSPREAALLTFRLSFKYK